ncbi:hypothetical protein BDR07DRAFT_20455 [Suillus spraguei]|nr:hypothetical protein BDR07DRAFT_20455 [Suillus spraguei]
MLPRKPGCTPSPHASFTASNTHLLLFTFLYFPLPCSYRGRAYQIPCHRYSRSRSSNISLLYKPNQRSMWLGRDSPPYRHERIGNLQCMYPAALHLRQGGSRHATLCS